MHLAEYIGNMIYSITMWHFIMCRYRHRVARQFSEGTRFNYV